MPMDHAALKAEIEADPKGLGYAAKVRAGDDAGLAGLLNARTGPGAGPVALASVSRDEFLRALRPAYLKLPTKDDPTQAKWDRILAPINSGGPVTVDATTVDLLAAAVSDGILTAPEAEAAWHRVGSRAEVLFGAGTVASNTDISFALRGDR